MGIFSRLLGERSPVMEMTVTKQVVLALEMLRAALAVHPDERVRSRWIHYDVKAQKDPFDDINPSPFFRISLRVRSGVEIDAECWLFCRGTDDKRGDVRVHLGKRDHSLHECREKLKEGDTPCFFSCCPRLDGMGMGVFPYAHGKVEWLTVSCTGVVTKPSKH